MLVVIDTHVHLHHVFPVDVFFDHARINFNVAAGQHGGDGRTDILCLTDMQGVNSVRNLCEHLIKAGAWNFKFTEDGHSIAARHDDGYVIFLLPGRQIISTENLELLALDASIDLPDRTYPIDELISRVIAAGGVPVAPWGFGKWSGARGKVMSEMVHRRSDFFVAHNGNRWWWAPEHRIFSRARRRGVSILSGSDPLPFASAAGRAGSSGIIGELTSPASSPRDAFRRLIKQGGAWRCYGGGVSTLTFISDQLRMQIRKRHGRSS